MPVMPLRISLPLLMAGFLTSPAISLTCAERITDYAAKCVAVRGLGEAKSCRAEAEARGCDVPPGTSAAESIFGVLPPDRGAAPPAPVATPKPPPAAARPPQPAPVVTLPKAAGGNAQPPKPPSKETQRDETPSSVCISEKSRRIVAGTREIVLQNSCKRTIVVTYQSCDMKSFGGACKTETARVGAQSTEIIGSFQRYPDGYTIH